MRTELLLLVPDDESFCSNKKAFVDFLKVDALITVSGQKISFRRAAKSKELVSARFRIETDKVKSKHERYFLLTLECQDESLLDEFTELCDRIRIIGERLSPGRTAINTIWDDVGRIYAEKSYPLINEVENLLRRLIAKFMLITVGVNWSKDTIHPELFKKIESFDDPEPYTNDLYKLDFIHLKQVLFEKKRDISLDELDRLLSRTSFSDEDKEKIQKYIPRSNWEKYFSTLIDDRESSLEKKWEILYKLRNKVAHNRHVKKEEYEKIKGLTSQIKIIIDKASAKLGEIDLNEEDRELIIYSYGSDSPTAINYLTEKAVAEYYVKSGYDVTLLGGRSRADFLASKDGIKVAVDVKSTRSRDLRLMIKSVIDRERSYATQPVEGETFAKRQVVVVVRDYLENPPPDELLAYVIFATEAHGFDIQLGWLNEDGAYVLLEK
ncbi:MAG TPA: hypothetical protein VF179_17090 [Thermoanaerobaculia bacterium]|nr:hypothetical protein [Thermoanaerobaculia bacterium]